MLRSIPLLLLLFLASCTDSATDVEATLEAPTTQAATTPVSTPVAPSAKNGTLLCEINGQPWHYTKASGIITTNRESGARTAIFTFKKKLDKGSESIQLYYDADTYAMQRASIQLKSPKKAGGLMTGFYELGPDTRNKLPGNELSGTIDLSDLKEASGTGALVKVGIKWEKEALANPEDAVVSLTDLRFSGVGYSDLTRVKKKLGI